MDTSPLGRQVPLVGKRFRDLEIIQDLGTGPYGQVFLARDQAKNRLCAVKGFDPARCSIEGLRKAHAIASAVADVHGAQAPAVYNLVIDEGAGVQVVEYIAGEDLDDLRRRHGSVPWDEARAIFGALAETLAAAHRNSLHHGDLKPGNVRIQHTHDGGLRVYALDWGTGTFATGEGDERTQVDVQRVIDYHAPEQLRGADTSAESDMYSVGVLLFEAVTGRRPFVGSPSAVAMDHIRQEPPRPREFSPTLPSAAEALILALLRKDPTRRPTAHDLQATLSSPPEEVTATAFAGLDEPATQVYVRPKETTSETVILSSAPPQTSPTGTKETVIVGSAALRTPPESTRQHTNVTRYGLGRGPSAPSRARGPEIRLRRPQWLRLPATWTIKHSLIALNSLFVVTLLVSVSVLIARC